MSQKIKNLIVLLALVLLATVGYSKAPAIAATCSNPATDSSCVCSSQGCDNGLPAKNAIDCASGKLDPHDSSKCVALGNECNGNTADTCLKKDPIVTNLNSIIAFLSAGVGIVVIGVIIFGGIRYTLAGDNPTATGEAKKLIINGLVALAAFLFLFAFLQWLVPGGL